MADYNALNQNFLTLLGRPITQDEFDYLGKFVDQGHLQPQEIAQILQSTPEFQQNLLNKNTAAYGDILNQQNKGILDQAAASANSQFANLGRNVTSAQGASVMQAGGALAQQRQSALADFYGRGLNNVAGLYGQQGSGALQRGYGLRDEARQRGYQIEDYYRQKNDFADYQNAHSGWNAITPEFVIGQSLGIGGKLGAAYLGGGAGGVGLSSGGSQSALNQLNNINKYGAIGGYR